MNRKVLGGLKSTAITSLISIITISSSIQAEIPLGYYDTADPSSTVALRNSLNDIIDDHQRFPYTSSETDTWDILEIADENPDDPMRIIDIYLNASYEKQGGGNSFYNREHTWPKSYGFPDDGDGNYPYTDAHHLFLSNSGYNSSRSNKPYDNCDSGCNELTTESNNGRGGSSTESNWTIGSFTDGSWETWDGRKGDVARALMYMDVRYDGNSHSVTGFSEPDLILTNDRSLIDSSNTGTNGSVAYMGLLSVLIEWHKSDPVDDFERRHTDAVYNYQGNRNPFIDHPEYVACVFENICSGEPDTEAPNPPSMLMAESGAGQIGLSWSANSESDIAGYNIYRSEVSGGEYTQLNGSIVSNTSFIDTDVTAFVTYYYVISAVDNSLNESALSSEVFGSPGEIVVPEIDAWVNEFHYDNASTDVGEFIEIAGAAGTDLTGWSLVLYNGNGGTVYQTVELSGIISDDQSGFGAISFEIAGIQNGAPDGFALVDNTNTVIQFLSYEGSFTANGGAADGMTSIDVGVSESSSTEAGNSLQLSGTGSNYGNFVWQSARAESPGFINDDQFFSTNNQLPSAEFSYACIGLTCNFDGGNSVDPDGDIVDFIWTFGDGNVGQGSLVEHTYADFGSYTVTLEVVDNNGATSTQSQEVELTDVVNPPAESNVWVNEFHYDNAGADVGEFIEVAGEAGVDLSGWSLVLYNGNGGSVYRTIALSGIIDNEQNGYGALTFEIAGIQNGGPDGFALVSDSNLVIQFLSYEGSFVANGGAADGILSTDIGVSEASSTAIGDSLQLTGSGSKYSDFTWQSVAAESAGSINSGQTFLTPNISPFADFIVSCQGVSCSFDASLSSDADGQIIEYHWNFGDGSEATGTNVDYSYNASGLYTVTLMVTDNEGSTATTEQNIEVIEPVNQDYFENNTMVIIPDLTRVQSEINVERPGLASTIKISVNISHTYRGDLGIRLKAPNGKIYKLKKPNRFDNGQDIVESYTVDANCDAEGLWILYVKDTARKDTGQLNSWSMEF